LYSALSDLVKLEKITVLQEFALTKASTKSFIDLLGSLGVEKAQRILVLVSDYDDNLSKSARNLGTVIVSDIQNINIYNLLTCDHLVATPDTLKALEKQISSEAEAA
jgi:large subunit ribosomal protein L4